MPRKIITVDKEANLGLVRAKRDRRESLSALIKRARWRAGKKRCGDLLGRVGACLIGNRFRPSGTLARCWRRLPMQFGD